jgi:DNA polymerase I-like protein with 3'-5' exonuclease and polymerase domains
MEKWTRNRNRNDRFLSDHLIENGITSYSDFVEHVKKIEKDFWDNRFSVYKKWKDTQWKEYQRKGYLDLYTGFRCSGIMSKNDVTNYGIQGSAFHCNLWCFIQVDKFLREGNYDSKLIGQIHDSMILDLHPDEKDEVLRKVVDITTKQLLNHFKWISIPMEVEIETTGIDEPWSDKKEYKLST